MNKTLIVILIFISLNTNGQGSTLIGAISGRNTATAPPSDAPVNTVLPVISDLTPKVGEEITSTSGTWTNSPTSILYEWRRNGTPVAPGTESNSYTPTSLDYNQELTVRVEATNAAGLATVFSEPTANVLPANPVNVIAPLITGIYQSGQTLSCSQGSWTGQGTITYSYQWLRDGVNIGGATASTYEATINDEEKTLTVRVTASNSGGGTDYITNGAFITDPSLSTITSDHVYSGSDKMLIYTPPGYSNNSNDYPVLFVYHGDGERGVPVNSNHLAGTGNGSQTVFSGNITLSNSNNRIIHSSVYVQVNGVTVATGRRGVITGDGITGTYSFDVVTTAPFSITFTTAPASSHEVRIYYTQSNLIKQQFMRFLNLGDEPNLIVVAPQISAVSGGFITANHWTAPIDYLINNGYRVDTNRLYSTGFSLGGVVGMLLFSEFTTTTYPPAAFVDVSPGAVLYIPSGGSPSYAATRNRGMMIARGTSDPNGATQLPSIMANTNGDLLREFPWFGINYWGINHSPFPDTYVYNRKNRTDATGTAAFDFIDEFLLLFSLDLEEQADLWVTHAEATLKSEHYRLAKIQTDNLTAGATKTALLGRLTTLKSLIGNSVFVDFGGSFYNSTGNYNNVNSAASGTTKTNLIDDEGTDTGWTYTTVTSPAASPALLNDIGVSRVMGRQFGHPHYFQRDGMLISSAGTTGTLKFSGLDDLKTYTLKIYSNASANAWTARAEVECVAGGVTKYAYNDLTNFRLDDDSPTNGYVLYTGLIPASGEISFTIRTRQTANTERNSYLQGLELIETP
jgi:hypothetical protein